MASCAPLRALMTPVTPEDSNDILCPLRALMTPVTPEDSYDFLCPPEGSNDSCDS